MSPARARTSDAAVVAAARDLLEAGGVEAVTMQAIALRVGVRAPSLYKRFAGRSGVLLAVIDDALVDLAAVVAAAGGGDDPRASLVAIGRAFHELAARAPNATRLMFEGLPDGTRPSSEGFAAAVAPVLDACSRLVGPELALEAARTLTAFSHGFTSMERAGAFGLGGDVDAAFRYGLSLIVAGLHRDGSSPAA